MGASSEVRFKIGADTSALQRGFIEAETRAAQLNKAFEKKLGAKDAFKGLVAGLGLGITEISTTIARALSGLSEETERSLTAIVAATERARQALDSQLKGRRTAGQNVEFNSEDQRRLQEELAGINARKPMRPEQRFISGMGMGVGTLLSNELEKNGFRSHRLEERAAEISAELQDLAGQKEALENAKRDAARTKANSGASLGLAGRRAAGMPGTHEGAQYLELIRQENSLRDEAAEKTTSQARREQLILQADQLVTRQLEMAAHWRETNRATAERIEQIERETAAVGETKGEAIRRLKRDALDADKKSRDLTRSEDERRGFRVQSAEKMAAAAKAEYDYKVKTANLGDSLKTPSGRTNTTSQGVLANRATNFRAQAERARAQGRFGAAVHFGELADQAEESFFTHDRQGMIGALGRDPRKTGAGAKPSASTPPPAPPELKSIDGHLGRIEASLTVVSVD